MKTTYRTALHLVRGRAAFRPGVVFRTAAPFDVRLHGLTFRVPAGTTTDLASIPRAWRWLFDRLGPMLEASVVHDAAYRGQLRCRASNGEPIAWALSRAAADALFLALLLAVPTPPPNPITTPWTRCVRSTRRGVWIVKSYAMYFAVRLGGIAAWRSSHG